MRTIASVALKSLNKLKVNIESSIKDRYAPSNENIDDLYRAWCELRRSNGRKLASFHEWANTCLSLTDELINNYINGKKEIKRLRHTYLETFNVRVNVEVMGGYNDCPEWESKATIFLTTH